MSENIAIIGAGLMGASSAYQLAKLARENNRDITITVFEHAPEGVQRGGSMGNSRITRLNTRDVPMVCSDMIRRSNEVALQMACVTPAHALTLGNWKEKIDPAIQAASLQPGMRHDIIDSKRLEAKYPWMNAVGIQAVDEEPMTGRGDGAGVINPHKLIATLLEEAQRFGSKVQIRYETPITDLREEDGKVVTQTASGETQTFDKAILAGGMWSSKLMGTHHPVGRTIATTAEAVYLFKAAPGSEEELRATPSLMLKIKGGWKFATEHPDFIKKYPRFTSKDACFQAYTMMDNADQGLAFKIGVCKPEETTPKDPDMLLRNEAITPETHQFAADIIAEFFPGIAAHLPGVKAGKADDTMVSAYACTPDYVPVISPLREGSNITVIAADAGTSGKFAVESGRFGACYALDMPELIPDEARKVFSMDRPIEKVARPELSRYVLKSAVAQR